MSDPTLSPDQFLYGRKGPWPQPSPSHPLVEACEVLTIPPNEMLLWNSTIGDDLYRGEMAQAMCFAPAAIQPNLAETLYPFTNPILGAAELKFHLDLLQVSADMSLTQVMPLVAATPPATTPAYAVTIPASIQY